MFGVPIVLEDTQNEDDIIDFILNVEDHGDALISVNDMKAYVSFVSKFQTCFEPEADALLNNYYSSTRKLRESKKSFNNKLSLKCYSFYVLFKMRYHRELSMFCGKWPSLMQNYVFALTLLPAMLLLQSTSVRNL